MYLIFKLDYLLVKSNHYLVFYKDPFYYYFITYIVDSTILLSIYSFFYIGVVY